MKIGLFFGSTTGNTMRVASDLQDKLGPVGNVELYDIAKSGTRPMSDCDLIILGSSTWGFGELQDDWARETPFTVDLTGKKAALFGLGDQMHFPDTFVDAMGILADEVEKAGAKLVGTWPADEYDFSGSIALRDGKFLGLAIDEENEPDLTDERLDKWIEQIQKEVQE
jgi:flavodoxin I